MEDRLKIQEVIARFANSFDVKTGADSKPASPNLFLRIIPICVVLPHRQSQLRNMFPGGVSL